MARKPNLDATSRAATAYSDFTKNYRQSSNVLDQRDGKGYQRDHEARGSPTPKDAEYGARTSSGRIGRTSSAGDTQTPDDYATSDIGSKSSPTTPPNSTRKVDPEEAVQRTHRDRK